MSSRRVINNIDRIEELFDLPVKQISGWGLEEESVLELRSPGNLEKAKKELDSALANDYFILTIADSDYPAYLREIYDPPCVLYGAGRRHVLEEPSVSLVGSRKPSPYGRGVVKKLARDLAEKGLVIVSGMARGIDSLAHWGALEKGRTVAVLGSGLGNIYPRENMKLFNKIKEDGAVITEFSFHAAPLGFHFPLRNRLISGLSLAVVVIEAAQKSGSLISARLALEQNREVMAVPGNITSANSWGSNWLIKNGAKLVSDWEDVAEELPPEVKKKVFRYKPRSGQGIPSLSPDEQALLSALALDDVTHIDEIAAKTSMESSKLLSLLLSLELRGIVSQYPGKYFQRNA
ncbi:MAG: DNA-processing protein DprA [Candidatus Aminicenantes bacterium]